MASTSSIPASSPSPSATERGPGAAPAATSTPGFFDEVPPIVVRDALAEALGAAEGGVLEYRYLDAVKLAGHSCPTVAGAWLMTRRALALLHPGELPRRGEVQVELRQGLDEGVAGVVAGVVGLVTGAAGEGGFKGLAGRHARRGLLRHGVPMAGEVRFTRLDDGRSVELAHHPQRVPRPAALARLLPAALAPGADAEARRDFARCWQAWVREILLVHADDPALIEVVA